MARYHVDGSVRENGEKNAKGEFKHAPVNFAIDLDFDKVTPEQLMALAANSLIVTMQGNARRAIKAKDNKRTFAKIVADTFTPTVSVVKLLENARGPAVSKPQKIAKAFAELSPEMRKALLAELSKSAK